MSETRNVPVAWARETAGGLQVCYLQTVMPPVAPWEDGSGEWIPLYAAAPTERRVEPLYIIFDGPPSNESGRFVEVETADGHSVRVGEWTQKDGYWKLGPFYAGPVPTERRVAQRRDDSRPSTPLRGRRIMSDDRRIAEPSDHLAAPDSRERAKNAAGQVMQGSNGADAIPESGPVPAAPEPSKLPLSAETCESTRNAIRGATTWSLSMWANIDDLCDQALRAIEQEKVFNTLYERAHMLERENAELKRRLG